MEGVDDRIEHAGAIVSPARGVECDRQLAVSVFVNGCDHVHQVGERGALIHPGSGRDLHGVAELAAAVMQQGQEEIVAASEMVGDTGVGHRDSLCDGTDLDGPRPAFDQELLGRLENQLPSFGRGAADAGAGHDHTAYLDMHK